MALASRLTQDILRLADAYCAHEFRSLDALSGMVVGKGGFFARLKRGGGCTVKTFQRLVQFFSDNWPADLEWPRAIARPTKTKKEAA